MDEMMNEDAWLDAAYEDRFGYEEPDEAEHYEMFFIPEDDEDE